MDSTTHANTSAAPRDAAALAPDEVTPAAPEAVVDDPLDAILRQIVGGYFVLTDGQGSVSKWSEPAELLFGRPAAEMLGQPFFGTLVGAPLPAGAEAWRAFLESGEPPGAPGRVEVSGRHADGTGFAMEAVFVPVKLDEGFDFSLFLEDLGFELPMNLMLLRMRQQHPVVVRALRQALEPEPQPWEGWRTAGTLVVFRPLGPTPWVESELAAREAARAEADAEAEERLAGIDPGIQGNSVADLDDAAAVVARLLSAMERIDELERVALGLPSQLEEARQSAERRAEAAEREARELREEMQRALAGDDSGQRELVARLERLERGRLDAEQATEDRARALETAESARAELAARLDRLELARAESSAAADARLAAAVADAQRSADGAREDIEARLAEIERVRAGAGESHQAELTAQLERVRAEHEEAAAAARAELSETLDRLERDRARDAEAARAELAAALQRVEHVQREADALREQLGTVTVERHEVSGLAAEDHRRLDDLARDAEASRARIEEGAATLDALRHEVATDVGAVQNLDERVAEIDRGAGSVLSDVRALRERLDEVSTVAGAAGEAATSGRAESEELRAAVARLTGELEVARSQVEHARNDAAAAQATGARAAERLDALDGRTTDLRTELTAGRERLDALGTQVERLGKDVVEAGQSADAVRAAVEAQGAELRQELAAVRRVAEDAWGGLDALRAEVEAVRGDSKTVRDDAASARIAAEGAERRVEAMQAELTFALTTLEELKAGLTSAGQAAVMARREAEQAKRAAETVGEGNSGVNEVFQQLLAAARGGGQKSATASHRPLAGSEVHRRPQAAKREPRHGFDDVSRPQAILGLDGKFRELNPAFARLVGYQEHEFAKAAWPSPHDRALYQQQQGQLRQLVSGEMDSVSVQSTYMHGQGLMVPIVGTLKVVPGEDGLPLHLLLEAEERATG